MPPPPPLVAVADDDAGRTTTGAEGFLPHDLDFLVVVVVSCLEEFLRGERLVAVVFLGDFVDRFDGDASLRLFLSLPSEPFVPVAAVGVVGRSSSFVDRFRRCAAATTAGPPPSS